MRACFALPVAALALCFACSSFHDDPTPGGPDGGSDAPIADGTLGITPIADVRSLVPGRPTMLNVMIQRASDVTGTVTLRLKNARDGITAADVTITGDTGALAVIAPANAPVGGSDAVLEASSGDVTATTPLHFEVLPTPGSLDTTFGVGSILTKLFAATCESHVADLVTAPDNSIYVVGMCVADSSTVVARRLVDGQQDTQYVNAASLGLHNPHRAMVQKLNGATQLVVAGGNATDGGEVGRITIDGVADTTAQADGFPPGVTQPIGSSQHNGVAGIAITPSTGDVYLAWDEVAGASDYVGLLLHLYPTLTVDTGPFGDQSYAANVVKWVIGISTGMVVTRDERSLVTFGIQSPATGWIARRILIPTGIPDATFASDPHPLDNLSFERPHAHYGPIELADGSFVMPLDTVDGFYVVKVDSKGVPVSAFGGGPYAFGQARGITVSGDGFIVVTAPSSKAIGLVRLDANGKPDSTFGNGGFVSTPIDDGAVPEQIIAQKSGRLLVGITHTKNGVDEAAVVAFWP